jgi:hypothetical protein
LGPTLDCWLQTPIAQVVRVHLIGSGHNVDGLRWLQPSHERPTPSCAPSEDIVLRTNYPFIGSDEQHCLKRCRRLILSHITSATLAKSHIIQTCDFCHTQSCGLFSYLLACVERKYQDKPAQKLTFDTIDEDIDKYFANDPSHVTVSALSPPLTRRLPRPQCTRPRPRKQRVYIAA